MAKRRTTVDWDDPKILRRLGAAPDRVVAAELGVTEDRVRQVRKLNRIRSFARRAREVLADERRANLDSLPRTLLERLGTAKDSVLAREFTVPRKLVRAARLRAGIDMYRVGCGTLTRYRAGCRCDLCRATNAASFKAWRVANPAEWARVVERRKKRLAT